MDGYSIQPEAREYTVTMTVIDDQGQAKVINYLSRGTLVDVMHSVTSILVLEESATRNDEQGVSYPVPHFHNILVTPV